MRMTQLRPGMKIRMTDARGYVSEEEFLGFTAMSDPNHIAFETLAEVKDYYGVRSQRALEELERNDVNGTYSVYAQFRNLNPSEDEGEGYVWGAYLFNGRWAIGSSADYISVEEIG